MTGYDFPDVPGGLLDIVPHATMWLRSVAETVNHIYSVGGTETGPERMDRITVDTYARGRDAARDEAEAVRKLLLSGSHDTPTGMIDSFEVEVVPHDARFQSDEVTQYQAIYRAYSRPI